MKSLQRRRVGPFHVDQALELASLTEDLELSLFTRAFWNLDQVLDHFSAVEVDKDDAQKVLHGNAISWNRIVKQAPAAGSVPEEGKRVRVAGFRKRTHLSNGKRGPDARD